MRLSAFSDYSLRVLMVLGTHTDRLVTIAEIAKLHGISENHLTKIVHQLGRAGYIETLRGKGGGMRLARAPREIALGDVLRRSETDFALVECFGPASRCHIEPGCQLKIVLGEALDALFRVLDSYTLADILHPSDHHAPLAARLSAANHPVDDAP
nr:Rrf2 family transcriptional regulator [Zoogloeaceae bacterium]